MTPDNSVPAGDRLLCSFCVEEEYLAQKIRTTGVSRACSNCGKRRRSWTIADVAKEVEVAFGSHYVRTSDDDGEPVQEAVASAAGVPRRVAEWIQDVLEETHYDMELAKMGESSEFASDTYYAERSADVGSWQMEWRGFEHSLKTSARFFNSFAAAHLASVFGGIDRLSTSEGQPLVVAAGPNTAIDHLYRARVFQSTRALEEALAHPDEHLGSPPSNAARAGRMNAHGISVFYGATQAGSAIAEVRPPVGSRVALAKFTLKRPLKLLDLSAIGDVHDTGSIFDPSFKSRLERVAFLSTLGLRMTKPVMPDDEVFDYLATQAIADFLANMNEPRLDGIVYSSAQSKAGRNVVLFHHASLVESIDFPFGTKIRVDCESSTEDDPEPDYVVWESLPPESEVPELAPPDWLLALDSDPTDDLREVTLRVDSKCVAVHHVEWVDINTNAFGVQRYQLEIDRDTDF